MGVRSWITITCSLLLAGKAGAVDIHSPMDGNDISPVAIYAASVNSPPITNTIDRNLTNFGLWDLDLEEPAWVIYDMGSVGTWETLRWWNRATSGDLFAANVDIYVFTDDDPTKAQILSDMDLSATPRTKDNDDVFAHDIDITDITARYIKLVFDDSQYPPLSGNNIQVAEIAFKEPSEPLPPPVPQPSLLPPRPAGISRGHWILLHKGLNIHAVVYASSNLDMARFAESNFTGVNMWNDNNPQYFGDPPGIPWSRVAWFGEKENLAEKEITYIENLTALQWGDEQQGLSTPGSDHLNWATDWFAQTKGLYPDVIGYTNQWGSQISLGGLQVYMQAAQPDMLMFDHYGYGGGYEYMDKYRRAAGLGNDGNGTEPIPWASYLYGFRSWPDGDIPSESQIRRDQFSPWTFGAKFAILWFYNRPSDYQQNGYDAILFDNGSYDEPTQAFYHTAETNRQSRNLGPTLIRLQSTDARFVPGDHHPINVDEFPDDNMWAEANDGWVGHPGPYLVQKNGENVDLNPLTLSVTVPNGDYEITMTNVYMHGANSGGGGNYLITASAEGTNISKNTSNGGVADTRDIPLATGGGAITVSDSQLDIELGNCYTNHNYMGNWFSFEGFEITGPAGVNDLHYSDFALSYNPPGLTDEIIENGLPSGMARWDANADPYITDINATNLGSVNFGLKGDVVVGYFQPLMEIFDGPDDTNEIYFMILNGLVGGGPGADANVAAQSIHIEFDFTSRPDVNSLQRLSRDTGQVEIVPLVHDTGFQYHLDLVLDGGTADLFKFNTSAPFITDGSCDFNYDGDVDLTDYAILINWWLTDYCGDPGWCFGKDVEKSGDVSMPDLAALINQWLEY